jgi:hypothetical protein
LELQVEEDGEWRDATMFRPKFIANYFDRRDARRRVVLWFGGNEYEGLAPRHLQLQNGALRDADGHRINIRPLSEWYQCPSGKDKPDLCSDCNTKLVRSTRRAVTPEYCTRVFNEESDYFHPAFGFFHAECDVCGTDLWQVPHESPEDALREDFQAELLILLRGAGVVNHDDGTTGLPVDAIMAQLADSPYAPTQYTADAIGGLLDALQDRNWLFQDDDGDGTAMIYKI